MTSSEVVGFVWRQQRSWSARNSQYHADLSAELIVVRVASGSSAAFAALILFIVSSHSN